MWWHKLLLSDFLEAPDRNYFGICRPWGLYHNCSALPLGCQSSQIHENKCLCSNKTLFVKLIEGKIWPVGGLLLTSALNCEELNKNKFSRFKLRECLPTNDKGDDSIGDINITYTFLSSTVRDLNMLAPTFIITTLWIKWYYSYFTNKETDLTEV